MQINSINQSFGKLYIATKRQRQEISEKLDSEHARYLFNNIKYDPFETMKITKAGSVYVYDYLSFDKPKKIEDKNADLISKVKKGIDMLRSAKCPDHRSNRSYAGGEVAAPTFPFGYGGGGWGY